MTQVTAMARAALVLTVSIVLGTALAPQQNEDVVRLVRLPAGGIQPQVAVDSRGVAHVVYFKGEAANGDLFYARLGDIGAFSTPVRVNSHPESAIATGNVRGARLAVGRNGRVHVAWNGSGRAMPRAAGGATPMLYTRMNRALTAFEPQRNLLQFAVGLDGGGAIAADAGGRVYVAWHAGGPESKGEGDRRVWVTKSSNDGMTFGREQLESDISTGACGCCGMSALIDRRGTLDLLYRSAREVVHRDTYLLSSKDAGLSFASTRLQEWNVGTCPMSTYALIEGPSGVFAAWETGGQVQFVRIDPATGMRSPVVDAPGALRTRKHPALAANARGDILLAWTEGMSWQRGGTLAWQIFDRDLRPTMPAGRAEGVPMWSLVAAYARPNGGFTIVY